MMSTPEQTSPDSTSTGTETGTDLRGSAAITGAIPQPRGTGIPLGDEPWQRLARAYLWSELIELAVGIVLVAAASVLLATWTGGWWPWVAGGTIEVGLIVLAAITPRQVRSFGYRLRADDIVMRRGILFQREVAVPYGRLQLVDVTHGPLDRLLGIAQLKLVTAAASAVVVLPGLEQAAAEDLRDRLVALAESRRTPL